MTRKPGNGGAEESEISKTTKGLSGTQTSERVESPKPGCPPAGHVTHGMVAGLLQVPNARSVNMESVSVNKHTTVPFTTCCSLKLCFLSRLLSLTHDSGLTQRPSFSKLG